jgi:hypothetical protein
MYEGNSVCWNEDNKELNVVENHLFDIDEEMNLYMMVIDMMFDRNFQSELDQHKIMFQTVYYYHR